jgi:carbon-monoxide dehydrogenase large subunit
VLSSFESRYTHRVPVTPYRGAGQPQAVFVIERVLDLVARETGRERAEVRRANLVRPEDMPWDVGLTNYRASGNVILDSGDFPSVLRRALESAGYDALRAEATAARAQGASWGGARLLCRADGCRPSDRARAGGRGDASWCSRRDQGQVSDHLRPGGGDELGHTPDDVRVIAGDTAASSTGSARSRAGRPWWEDRRWPWPRAMRAKALVLAARPRGVAEAALQQRGAVFPDRRRLDRRMTFAELARAAAAATAALGVEPGLESTRFFQPADMTYSSGAHVARVEIDPLSARVTVTGYWITHDSGRLINPMVVEGQIQGGVALGIGSALLQEIVTTRRLTSRAATWTTCCHGHRCAEHDIDRKRSPAQPARHQGRGRIGHAPRPRGAGLRHRRCAGPTGRASDAHAARAGPPSRAPASARRRLSVGRLRCWAETPSRNHVIHKDVEQIRTRRAR